MEEANRPTQSDSSTSAGGDGDNKSSSDFSPLEAEDREETPPTTATETKDDDTDDERSDDTENEMIESLIQAGAGGPRTQWYPPEISQPAWKTVLPLLPEEEEEEEDNNPQQRHTQPLSLSSLWVLEKWRYRSVYRNGVASDAPLHYAQRCRTAAAGHHQHTSLISPIEALCLVSLCALQERRKGTKEEENQHESDRRESSADDSDDDGEEDLLLDVAFSSTLASMIAFIPFQGVRVNPRYRGGGINLSGNKKSSSSCKTRIQQKGGGGVAVESWPLVCDHETSPIPQSKLARVVYGMIEEDDLDASEASSTTSSLEEYSSSDSSSCSNEEDELDDDDESKKRKEKEETMKELKKAKLGGTKDPEARITEWLEIATRVATNIKNSSLDDKNSGSQEEKQQQLLLTMLKNNNQSFEESGFMKKHLKWRQVCRSIDFGALCLASTHISIEQFLDEHRFQMDLDTQRSKLFGACGALGNVALFFGIIDAFLDKSISGVLSRPEYQGLISKEDILDTLLRCDTSLWGAPAGGGGHSDPHAPRSPSDDRVDVIVKEYLRSLLDAIFKYLEGATEADNPVAVDLLFRFTPSKYKRPFACLLCISTSPAPHFIVNQRTNSTLWSYMDEEFSYVNPGKNIHTKQYFDVVKNCVQEYCVSVVAKIKSGRLRSHQHDREGKEETATEEATTTAYRIASVKGKTELLIRQLEKIIPQEPIPKFSRCRVAETLVAMWIEKQPLPAFDGGYLDPRPKTTFQDILSTVRHRLPAATTTDLRGGRVKLDEVQLSAIGVEIAPKDPWSWTGLTCAMAASDPVSLDISVCGGGGATSSSSSSPHHNTTSSSSSSSSSSSPTTTTTTTATTRVVVAFDPPSAIPTHHLTAAGSSKINLVKSQAAVRAVELALHEQFRLKSLGRLHEAEKYDCAAMWNNLAYNLDTKEYGKNKGGIEVFVPEENCSKKFTNTEAGFAALEEALTKRRLGRTHAQFDTLAMLMSPEDVFVCKPWPKHDKFGLQESDLAHLVKESECDPIEEVQLVADKGEEEGHTGNDDDDGSETSSSKSSTAPPPAVVRQKSFKRLDCCRMSLEVTHSADDAVIWFHLGWILHQDHCCDCQQQQQENKKGDPVVSISGQLVEKLGKDLIFQARQLLAGPEAELPKEVYGVPDPKENNYRPVNITEAECYALAVLVDEAELVDEVAKNHSEEQLKRLVQVLKPSRLSTRGRRLIESEVSASLFAELMAFE